MFDLVGRTIAAVITVVVLIVGFGGGFVAGQTSVPPITLTHSTTFTQTTTVTKTEQAGALASTTILASVGEDFYVTLDSNPSIGYGWQLAKISDQNALQLLGTEYKGPEGSPMPGAGGKQILSFKALREGKVTVTLEYMRSGEKDQPPARVYIFDVIVHP